MTDERKDSEWLKQQLIELLTNAKGQTEIDHTACASYAKLLWSMLPRAAETNPEVDELSEIRQKLINGDAADD